MSGLDPNNRVNALCAQGMEAESRHSPDEARTLFERAWAIRTSDLEGAIAAHYLARHQPTAELAAEWNMVALAKALQCEAELVAGLLPSLYLNAGKSNEDTGEGVAGEDLLSACARCQPHPRRRRIRTHAPGRHQRRTRPHEDGRGVTSLTR